ncbi:MAG: TonB-dependent receptor, partial [Bacteroidota bacterium]
MPSHGHGQGYEDLHFLIPETVEGMDIFKGPYAPQYGDFATAAAVSFKTKDSLENNLIQMESGYVPEVKNLTTTRALALLKMPDIGKNITSYFAADVINNRGYFEESQHFKRTSIFSKTTIAVSDHSHIHFSVAGFGSSWDASGQVPERAVDAGLISRFGSIDNSEGGTTQRTNVNLIYHTQLRNAEFETQVYSCNYRFKLFSNFTFFAEDTINGDEIEQDDNRTIRGLNARYTIPHKLGNLNNKFTLGVSYRADDIENQLWHAVKRERLEVRAHANIQERATGIYVNEIFRFSDQFRIEAGGRYDYFIFDVDDLLPDDSTHENYSGFNYQTLLSPKLNFIYTLSDDLQFFLNTGSGFHSNDARSAVQEKNNHVLPRAPGAELGSLIHITNRIVTSVAFWWMDVENELVYVGDDGTTENKGASRRMGIDFSLRCQFANWLYADADLNISKNRFIKNIYGDEAATDFYIPLAPEFTSSGGLTAKLKNGLETGVRYRYLASRPANESNTVRTRGYNVIDANISYTKSHYKIGLTFENLTNTKWNEAQFDTESRLPGETATTDELHFTPGTPFSAKLIFGYLF